MAMDANIPLQHDLYSSVTSALQAYIQKIDTRSSDDLQLATDLRTFLQAIAAISPSQQNKIQNMLASNPLHSKEDYAAIRGLLNHLMHNSALQHDIIDMQKLASQYVSKDQQHDQISEHKKAFMAEEFSSVSRGHKARFDSGFHDAMRDLGGLGEIAIQRDHIAPVLSDYYPTVIKFTPDDRNSFYDLLSNKFGSPSDKPIFKP